MDVVGYCVEPVRWGNRWVHSLLIVSIYCHGIGVIWDQVGSLFGWIILRLGCLE